MIKRKYLSTLFNNCEHIFCKMDADLSDKENCISLKYSNLLSKLVEIEERLENIENFLEMGDNKWRG